MDIGLVLHVAVAIVTLGIVIFTPGWKYHPLKGYWCDNYLRVDYYDCGWTPREIICSILFFHVIAITVLYIFGLTAFWDPFNPLALIACLLVAGMFWSEVLGYGKNDNKTSSFILRCIKCNQKLNEGDKFCHLCGSIGKEDWPSPTATSVAILLLGGVIAIILLIVLHRLDYLPRRFPMRPFF